MDFQRELKKKKCDKEEGDEPTNLISCLPDEIALEIFSRLPIKSVLQSRVSCRHWRMLTHDPHLVNMHLSQALTSQRLCLIIQSDYPIRNQLSFVEFSDVDHIQIVRKLDTPFARSMPEFSIIGSCNGLLCLVDSLLANSIYIYNPFTRDYKVLPKSIDFQYQTVIFGFGFHPVTKEYKVIKIIYYPLYDLDNPNHSQKLTYTDSHISHVEIYNLCTNEWRSIGEAPYVLEKSSSPGVLVSGRLHWMSLCGKLNGHHDRIIVSFDLSDDSFRKITKPESGDSRSWLSSYVVELGGCLCAFVHLPTSYGAMDIWVMKEYGVQESWVKEYTIRSHYSSSYIGPQLRKFYSIWRNYLSGKLVKILCLLKNGEILLKYQSGSLVSYNPDNGMFKNLTLQGIPKLFTTTVHVGSLNPVVLS
ncbi:F-box protein [Abeliophyllum distichum]|uniref:F-box protein n=1 Tax=Abeliophyllum distichum TaxID=126358 RepID=A0ABD1UIG5_9LAMI